MRGACDRIRVAAGVRRSRPLGGRGAATPWLLAAVLAALCAAPLLAQTGGRAQLRLQNGPYYAEVPIEMQVVIEGFEEEPRPEIAPERPASGGRIDVLAISPQISTSMSIVNGRMSQSRTVTWTVALELLIERPGPFELPPLEVRQGSQSLRLEGRDLVAVSLPVSEEVGVEIAIPERPVYLGQRVELGVRMTLAERLADSLGGYTLRSEIFDREEDFDFIDAEPSRGQQTLGIHSGGATLRLPASVERVAGAPRPTLAVTATRTLVPLRPGSYEIAPASLVLEEVTRWQRGLFPTDRRPAETRLHLARDLPRRLVVKELPAAGRPESFSGAVGSGFSLSVEADRSVVRVGDPITLTFTLRGDGNLENAGLPPLARAGLPAAFAAAEGIPPGILADGAKVFRVPVRVRDESVREIPPVEYSWFDPATESYRSVETAPIALSVRRGETVGAEAVVGGPARGSDPEAGERPPEGSASRPRFTLVGADLSIETDPDRLARAERDRFGGAALRLLLYALSSTIILAAVGMRARERVPPGTRERRARLARAAREVEAASRDLASPESLRSVAASLRSMQREAKAAGAPPTEGLEEFLAECEDRIYAPSRAATGAPALGERARELARKLAEAGR